MSDFHGANLEETSFYRAALEGAQFDDGKKPSTDPDAPDQKPAE